MIAIGPQNALIIKQGLRRHAVGPVLLVVIASDFLLAVLGVTGVGVLVEKAPWLITALRWVGTAYLLWFAWTCFRDARNPQSLDTAPSVSTPASYQDDAKTTPEDRGQTLTIARPATVTLTRPSVRGPVLAALFMSWINPGAYLDAVILGSVASQTPGAQVPILLGAMCATLTWFPILGFGARALSRPLSQPEVWRWINVAIGCMMVLIAVRIAFGL